MQIESGKTSTIQISLPEEVSSGPLSPNRTIALHSIALPSPPSGRPPIQFGKLDEFQKLRDKGALTQLRLVRNCDYQSLVYFDGNEMLYYVAMIQREQIWRVIVASDLDSADTTHEHFSKQTAQLAEAEIRLLQLKAQVADMEKLIAQAQDDTDGMQLDLHVAHTQQQATNTYQQNVRRDISQLDSERLALQSNLNRLIRRGQQLRQANSEALPYAQSRQ